MHNAWRGDEQETVEDAAASILAAAFGYGSTWDAEEVRHDAGDLDEEGTPMRYRLEALAIRRQGEVIEQASRYVPRNYGKWPLWVTHLPKDRQAEVIAWSDANPLQTRRGEVREFEKWNRNHFEVSVPEVRLHSRALIALHDAKLTPPQDAVLRTFALEDCGAAEDVARFAAAMGHSRDVARNALVYRLLYPNARHLHHTLKDRAWKAGMRESSYRDAEKAAADLLRDWLHSAAVRFMRAHGPVKRVFIPSASLNKAAPKRSRPRFSKGWDSRQRPGPVVIVGLHDGRARTPLKGGSIEGTASANAAPYSRVA